MNMSDLRALASDLMMRTGFAIAGGDTYSGARNVYSALGYKNGLTYFDFLKRYKRGGIAARIVEAYPRATWRGGFELIEDEDPTDLTEFEEAAFELYQRLTIPTIFSRADLVSGIGRYGVLFLGLPGEPANPAPKKFAADALKYLQPYDEGEVSVTEFDLDPKSVRFGLPLSYNINRTAVSGMDKEGHSTEKSFSLKVHYSRVIHIADGVLTDRVFGMPRLERVWNDLDDLDKVRGGGAEAFWRRAHQGTIFNLDKEMKIEKGEKEKIEAAADELVNNMRRTMAVRGMDVKQLGSDVADFSKPVDAVVTLIAGATGIPKRLLLGTERGELASTQDKENWEERVGDRREDFAESQMVRPFFDLLIEAGALPKPEKYTVRWPDIDALTANDRATIADKWTRLNTQSKQIVVLASEIRTNCLGLDPLNDEQIQEEKDRAIPDKPVDMVPGPDGTMVPAPAGADNPPTIDDQGNVDQTQQNNKKTGAATPKAARGEQPRAAMRGGLLSKKYRNASVVRSKQPSSPPQDGPVVH